MRISPLFAPFVAVTAGAALVLAAPALLSAQDHPAAPAKAPAAAAPGATAGTPVKLPVTVVDDHGNPVKGLTPADLTLVDSGHTATIQSFVPDANSPMTIGLVAQTSASQRDELGDLRLASAKFVDHTLPGTDDKAFVIQYAHEVDLLEDPTSTANKLHDSITQLGSPQFGNQNSGSDSGDQTQAVRHVGPGGTLYDAIYLASTEVMKGQPGRHILVLVTDGIDHGSKESVNDAVEAAQSAHTMLFAIYYKGEEETSNPNQNQGRRGGIGFPGGGGGGGGYPGGGRRGGGQPTEQPHIDGKKILEDICTRTGGYMIEGKHDKADESYSKLESLLKNQYMLSFTPDQGADASSYHRLTLSTTKKGVYPLIQQDFSQ